MSLVLLTYKKGEKERAWQIASDKKVICKYWYFCILADDLQLIFDKKWFILKNGEEKKVGYEEIKSDLSNQKEFGIWEQYGLYIVLVFSVAIGITSDPINTIGGAVAILVIYILGKWLGIIKGIV